MTPSLTILDTLIELCDWLTAKTRSGREVADHVGVFESQPADAIHFVPNDQRFAHGSVLQDRAENRARYLRLSLAQPGAVTPSELEARFGAFKEPVAIHWDTPPVIAFIVDPCPGNPLRGRLRAIGGPKDIDVVSGTIHEIAISFEDRG